MITYEQVLAANFEVCRQQSTKSIVINSDNIKSALSVQQWYTTAEEKSAALLRSLVIAHGFQDGNKRTSVIVSNILCPFRCTVDESEKVVLDIAQGNLADVTSITQKLYLWEK